VWPSVCQVTYVVQALLGRSFHDRTVATIRKTPFRPTNCEYVVRSLGVMKESDFTPGYNVALSSEDVDKVDYGQWWGWQAGSGY